MKIQENDPLYIILRSKRESTKFQILVDIAENQPSVRQQEIAAKLGITPQAVSDYIRDLVDDGMVYSQGRGSYKITYKGVDWVITNAEALQSYAKHVTRDIVQQVYVWTAIAESEIKKGDRIGLYMDGGFLYASHSEKPAMGNAVNDAAKGADVGIIELKGIIDHKKGTVHICKIPRVQRGGSTSVNYEGLKKVLEESDFIGAVGIESYISIGNAGFEVDTFFGACDAIIDAAFYGLECAIVIVDEEFTDFLKRIENSELSYKLHDFVSS
ncbi:MAG: winged helix-turn-helix transcriptional regulator [Methanomicrobiaceae archaeon]|nr:winged helix-turn-helix transcriptional regulator [Methanomicrobiaceae archaeon]